MSEPIHTMDQIGVCGVDAGMLMIGDPCYFIGPDSDAQARYGPKAEHWVQFLQEHWGEDYKYEEFKHQMYYSRCHAGLGVVFPTTDGDGEYPVYTCFNEQGRPRFAVVVMDETPIEDIVK